MVLVLLISLNCYMSTLRLVHYALLLTSACWKSNNTNARLMAFAPSLALDPTFGIHSHKTLDTAQPCHLLKPNWNSSLPFSLYFHTNIIAQFLLQCACVLVRACVRVCACVCVCVCSAFLFYFIFSNTLCKALCSTCVYNIIFRLICIMWALRALMSAW